MFAGSCIGVICLVISLEFLRRVQREYNRSIRRSRKSIATRTSIAASSSSSSSDDHEMIRDRTPLKGLAKSSERVERRSGALAVDRPTLFKRQLVRAAIHMVQFGVAYFIMLLAMSYNGRRLSVYNAQLSSRAEQVTSSFVSSSEHSLGPSYSAGIKCLVGKNLPCHNNPLIGRLLLTEL